jgi:hypothetical protein
VGDTKNRWNKGIINSNRKDTERRETILNQKEPTNQRINQRRQQSYALVTKGISAQKVIIDKRVRNVFLSAIVYSKPLPNVQRWEGKYSTDARSGAP